ncbi:DNA-dependent metalloprotease SPRTN [Stigmatopora nigra]
MDGDKLDNDYLLALHLQEEFNKELSHVTKIKDSGEALVPRKPERPLSIVDASWETLDPTPDVRAMFLEFNTKFFWGKLSGVEVKWSPRMTLCAGVCSYEGRGGLCSIRLSEPLLKLRPRKDLVETLLHEMIHALLFVTQNDRDRDGHGPEFCKHMKRINRDGGTNITVYHNFNEEVDVYRQHWWRCDGPCRNRKPYLGFVKRAMNRAPSSLDPWWGDHQRTCGGTYTKVKEPEGYGQKGKAKKKKKEEELQAVRKMTTAEKPSGNRDIRDIIAFSGKGFVLGGNPIPSTCSASLAVSKHATPSPRVTPAPQTPAKKSVGNTKAFININGSPVRLSEVGRRRQNSEKLKQTSLDSLLDKSVSLDSPRSSNSPIWTDSSPPSTSSQLGDAKLTSWKKRPLDNSASIIDLFKNKKLKTDDTTASRAVVVMVACPVCQVSVQESKVNEHLDTCLS